MQYFRGNLTRLKSLAEQKLPEGKDLYGYQGISRAILVEAVNAAYDLSDKITEKDESRFEVISLKRAGSAVYSKLKNFLESNAAEQEKQKEFDEFLDSLSALVEKTKITYFILEKHGIRNDEELARVENEISSLTAFSAQLKAQAEAVNADLKSIAAASDEIEERHAAVVSRAKEVSEAHGGVQKKHGDIEKIHNSIGGWDGEIEEYAGSFKTQSERVQELSAKTARSQEKLEKIVEAGESHAQRLAQSASEHAKLLDEIGKTLGDANRVGMAASFKARKDELKDQQSVWQRVFVLAIVMMAGSVAFYVVPTLVEEKPDWREFFVGLSILSPAVWLGWFAATQYGYTSKIREDYAFKYAAAMAYEGHKKAAREVDKELERTLLEISLFNMAQNPIRLYEDNNMHASPWHKFFDQLLEKLPGLKKGAVRSHPAAAAGSASGPEE